MCSPLGELLAKARCEVEAIQAAWLEQLAEYHHSGEWATDGFASAGSAVGALCRMDAGVAHGHVHLARKLEQLPVVADALRAGDISVEHARTIATAFTRKRAAEMSPVEDALVGVALIERPGVLHGVVRRVTDAIDGDGGTKSEAELHDRRRYHASRSLDNLLNVNGLFDPESADIHEAAINAEMKRDLRPDDARTVAQRRADAVTNLFRQSLNHGDVGTAHGTRPHVTYVIHADEHPGATPELLDIIRSERRQNRGLSATTLERIMCDCDITRVVVAGKSEILDVGRATRTATAAQWKALVLRDGHCQAPGCTQPPSRCEAHHMRPYGSPHNGRTDLDNMKLYCWHHHDEEHKHDAQPRARDG